MKSGLSWKAPMSDMNLYEGLNQQGALMVFWICLRLLGNFEGWSGEDMKRKEENLHTRRKDCSATDTWASLWRAR